MRPTLDLDPVVMSAARARARAENVSIGQAVSSMALDGLSQPKPRVEPDQTDGFPVVHVRDAPVLTDEMVRHLCH